MDNKVILVTDGGSNVQASETDDQAERLRDESDAEIFVVAIGDRVSIMLLNCVVLHTLIAKEV